MDGLRARPLARFAYHGRCLLVTDPIGRVRGAGIEGFYCDNTRLLSRLLWSVDGREAEPFAFSEVGHDAMLGYAQVTDPPGVEPNGAAGGAHLELAAFVGDGLLLRAEVANHRHHDRRLVLGLRADADFVDIADVEAGRPQPSGPVAVTWDGRGRLLRLDLVSDVLAQAVCLRVQTPAPVDWRDGVLRMSVSVPPRARCRVEVSVRPVLGDQDCRPPPGRFTVGPMPSVVAARLGEEPPELVTSDDGVNRAWRTALTDLASLPLHLADGPRALAAGIPIYDQFFGRDTLTTGWQALLALRTPLGDALRVNAAVQGSRIDDWRDEEPGKMIHQMGGAPASLLGRNPLTRYYGDYATGVDYVTMLGQYYAWTGDRDSALRLLPAARQVLTWLDRYGDLDRDGFLEYRCRSAGGSRNQGWKDAFDAIVDADGRQQVGPIVTCELQGYWYAALSNVAPVFAAAGQRRYARRLLVRADRLRARVNERLWLDGEDTYALGIGGDGRLLTTVASNAGHLLLTAVATPEQGRRLAHRIMRPDLFSGWGVRTLSTGNPAFHPFSYQLGSVWAVEQGSIAAGFSRYGCWTHLHQLARGFFDLADIFTGGRVPESVGGLARDVDHPHPGVYPLANAPQSWSASSTVLMVQALLGMRAFAPARLLLVDPHLPDWLPDLRLRGLRVGDAAVDLHVWRCGTRTRWRARVRTGTLHVVRRPPIRDPGARVGRAIEWLLSR